MKLAFTAICLLFAMVLTEASKLYPSRAGHQKQFNENIFRLNKKSLIPGLENHLELGDLSSIEEALNRLSKEAGSNYEMREKQMMESIVESLIDAASRLASEENEMKSAYGHIRAFALNDHQADHLKHDPLYSMRMWRKK